MGGTNLIFILYLIFPLTPINMDVICATNVQFVIDLHANIGFQTDT